MKSVGRVLALGVLFYTVGHVCSSNTAHAWTCRFENAQGGCYTWLQHYASFYINSNSFQTSFGSDSHLSGVNWTAYVVHSARAWAEGAGSGLVLSYGGSTTRSCNVNDDNHNVVGTTSELPTGALGVTWANVDEATGDLGEQDICISSLVPWSVRQDLPSNRFDFRRTLMHEFGHFLGAGELPENQHGIMRPGGTPGVSNHDLWGDDKAFVRFNYGDRAQAVYGQRFNPPSSWESVWQLNTWTNLPVGSATGRDDSGQFWVIRAEANTSRSGVRFRRAQYSATPTSTWTSTFYSDNLEHGPALAGSTQDERWVTAWPILDTYRGCNGLRIGVSDDLFETAFFFYNVGICTSHEVGLTYDDDSGRFVMAYVANGLDPYGAHTPGHVYVRTSSDGILWGSGTEVDTGVYGDGDASVACTVHGLCGVSFVRGDSNQRYDRQRAFTVDGSGDPVMGSLASHSNWVYYAPQLFVSTYGTQPPDTTLLLLDLTSITTGVHSQWYMSDGDFPVSGSWISLGHTSTMRSSIAYNPNRHYSTLFFLP